MSTAVKYYDSTMSGAPSLGNTAGALIGVLDACLVDGFGSVTVNSIVVASNVATVTVSGGHQFAMIGNTGPVITIAGASPSGLNGEWRVTVTSTTVFTFATSGISDQTATGTITAKRAPAGFSKAFSGTNKAAYRSDDVTGTRLYLRIDDTGTGSARCRGYETMSDVDTGTGPFPTDTQISGGLYVYKANGSSRPWTLFCDKRMFYLFIDAANNTAWSGGIAFGDGVSYLTSDAYGSQLMGSTSSTSSFQAYLLGSASGYQARAYSQVGSSLTRVSYSHGKTGGLGNAGQEYPSPVSNNAHFWPVEYWDSTNCARGKMAGLWNPVHDRGITNGELFEDIPQLDGRTLISQITATNYVAVFDLTGPWR